MAKIVVSFVTRPGHGSEGGVGWEFVKAAVTLANTNNEPLGVLIDRRDAATVAEALSHVPGSNLVKLCAVPLPSVGIRAFGDARTRQSYLAWVPGARRALTQLQKLLGADVVHQVTFATAVMPSVLHRNLDAKKIWGPLSVPWAASYMEGESPRRRDVLGVTLARKLALKNVAAVDLAIATNDITGEHLARSGTQVLVEPNVIVNLPDMLPQDRDEKLLSTVGLLTDAKRPWLAIEALRRHPDLQPFRLQFIGDGPLRGKLEEQVAKASMSDRVDFLGKLSHDDAIRALARSRVLVHPSVREGASWVVGEGAAVGVPAVVFADVGASSTVRLSANGGSACSPKGDIAINLAEGILATLARPEPEPTDRWSATRLPSLLDSWWS